MLLLDSIAVYENHPAAFEKIHCTEHVGFDRLAMRTCHSLDIEMPANSYHDLRTKNVPLEMYR